MAKKHSVSKEVLAQLKKELPTGDREKSHPGEKIHPFKDERSVKKEKVSDRDLSDQEEAINKLKGSIGKTSRDIKKRFAK